MDDPSLMKKEINRNRNNGHSRKRKKKQMEVLNAIHLSSITNDWINVVRKSRENYWIQQSYLQQQGKGPYWTKLNCMKIAKKPFGSYLKATPVAFPVCSVCNLDTTDSNVGLLKTSAISNNVDRDASFCPTDDELMQCL